KQFPDKFVSDMRAKLGGLKFDENGSVYNPGVYIHIISSEAACTMAYSFSLAWKFSGDEAFRTAVIKLLDFANRTLVRHNGQTYFEDSAVVTGLCSQGRTARHAYKAAMMAGDKDALAWLDEIFSNWPYNKEKHRFVERFTKVTHYPTSINGFLDTLNMIAEGAADSWLVGKETGNQELIEKAKDTICNYILPEQLDSGLFNYHSKREIDMEIYNDGETEYNYNLYLIYILSHLLKIDEAREILAAPLEKSMRALYERFHFSDGGIYTPVHWGWDHVFESTLLTANLAWRLYHYCGYKEYESICARAVNWLMIADMGSGNHEALYFPGLYWSYLFEDLLMDEFSVTGDVAEEAQVADTLEMVEKQLAKLPASRNHVDLFFGLQIQKIWMALQRKVNRMKQVGTDAFAAVIPSAPQKAVLDMPWMYPEFGYAGKAEVSYDDEALYLTVQTDCKSLKQPYTAAELYQGDGVLLELNGKDGAHVVAVLALEDGKPVIYKYNDTVIPFGGDLRCFKTSIPFGWYLEKSSLACEMKEEGLCYTAKLLWSELGVSAKSGDELTGGISINRSTLYGVDYNQWGKTVMEISDQKLKGTFTFA
ncbi:MAG: hypothetical protein IIY04_03930, partial [Oscillospiraceae bacterium]|nr:hypothetical protein [Oscillospiraceae bacterium]